MSRGRANAGTGEGRFEPVRSRPFHRPGSIDHEDDIGCGKLDGKRRPHRDRRSRATLVITFEDDLWSGRVCQADQQDDIAIERRMLLRKGHGRDIGAEFDSHRMRGGLNPAHLCCRRHGRLKRQAVGTFMRCGGLSASLSGRPTPARSSAGA